MPAFNDGHMHYSISVRRFGVADLNFTPGEEDTPEDAIIPDRPVVLDSYCGHVAMFNSKALELAGVLSADTPEPEAGILRRGADGVPDGYVQEPVLIGPLCNKIPEFDFTYQQKIDGMLEAQKHDPDHKYRNIIAHNMLIDPNDVKRMGENNIIANVQPLWMNENSVLSADVAYMYGADQHKRFYPFKSLIDAGVVCANGTDFTVILPDPMAAIQIAMARKVVATDVAWYERCKDIPAMAPAECVSLDEIVKAMTINVAYQLHMEDITGSLEVGKSAEVVLLDGDLENTAVEDICKLNVVETVIKGKTEFKAE